MSIYICIKCGSIENTAVGGYYQNLRAGIPVMCSECNTGKWHKVFEKKFWNDASYGVDKLLALEEQHDGSMINATEFLQAKGLIPK